MTNETKQLYASYQLGCIRLGELEMQKMRLLEQVERIDKAIAEAKQGLKSIAFTLEVQKQNEKTETKTEDVKPAS
jgi:hypothetical protein